MTTQAVTPSDVRNSTAMIPTSNTPISRMLYLRSDQADISYSPSDKRWLVSPIHTRGKQHNTVVRSLQIRHLFPNVRETVVLSTGTKTVVIPAGNYDPCMIARYLNDKLYPEVETVCWDAAESIFRFCPSINIQDTSTAAKLLGFKPGVTYTNATHSVLPANVWGPQRIIVNSNLHLFNIPINGRLAVIPITVKYGEMIHYNNLGSTYFYLCMNHQLQNIHITLTDEDGYPLKAYDEIPWDILISFEPIDNPGFQHHIETSRD